MKLYQLFFPILFFSTVGLAQDKTIPSVDIKTIKGDLFNSGNIDNNDKPIVISFWATWCAPCKSELNAIAEVYEEWKEATGLKLIAISIDDSRTVGRVEPYVNSQAWEYEVYLDINGDFKRAMNVNSVPHTFILDKNKNIVWQNNAYQPGSEEEIIDFINSMTE